MGKEEIRIKCVDGIELGATLYTPNKLNGAVIIAPATGIKRRFYNSFASYLADNDYGVICFNNRGVGDSINTSINESKASLISWGGLDMPAVLDHLKATFPGQHYHVIGHSAGGQLLGLMPNGNEVSSLFNFAASSGCLANMSYPFKFSALFFLNFFIPLSNFLFGQANCQWVGMGEALPKEVARQWSKWCNGKGYVEVDFGGDVKDHIYDELDFPSLWLHATDDGIANIENVKDMARIYSASKAEIISLDPSELGLKSLGHMAFFSSKNNELWKYCLDWLKKNG